MQHKEAFRSLPVHLTVNVHKCEIWKLTIQNECYAVWKWIHVSLLSPLTFYTVVLTWGKTGHYFFATFVVRGRCTVLKEFAPNIPFLSSAFNRKHLRYHLKCLLDLFCWELLHTSWAVHVVDRSSNWFYSDVILCFTTFVLTLYAVSGNTVLLWPMREDNPILSSESVHEPQEQTSFSHFISRQPKEIFSLRKDVISVWKYVLSRSLQMCGLPVWTLWDSAERGSVTMSCFWLPHFVMCEAMLNMPTR